MIKIRAKDLTIEEKAKLLIGKDFWRIDTLGGKIPDFLMNDGPVGIRQPRLSTNGVETVQPSIAYPSIQVLSQTWNEDLVYEMAKAIANDAIELETDIILAPGVNIKRLPHNGRNFEYVSEDPFLAGVMAKKYIEGIQDQKVGACLKHYAANNSEVSRNYKSMEIDERTLREIYLLPHEIATKAKPWLVMTAYNLVNGVRMSAHDKLYRILRNEFKFDGLIISDWGAVMNRTKSLKASLDLEMPYDKLHLEQLLDDIKNEKVDMEIVDASVNRIIDTAYKCEEMRKIRQINLSVEERYNIAEKVAEEGIVLLKNEDGALPLKKNEKVLVTGTAVDSYVFGGGSSQVTPREPFVKLIDSLKGEGLNVSYFRTMQFTAGAFTSITDLKGALNKIFIDDIDATIVTISQDNHAHSEFYNRQNLLLSNEQIDLIKEITYVSPKTIVVIYSGAPIEMNEWIDDVDAVLYVGYVGEKGNKAVAKILSGSVNPSGKLTETFPMFLEDVQAYHAYEDARVALYEEQLSVGYRQFVSENTPVLFPFGFGLSYSTFVYDNLKITKSGKEVDITLTLTNTSKIDGHEVAQVYVRERLPDVYRPLYELKGWKKVFLKAGETKTVSITLDQRSFSYYSLAHDDWHINENGQFSIYVSSSSIDIELFTHIKY
ncbi:MAG: glycoside hydrolase family 3 C-terminal domain-containing protein [Bacilli bacterium]|jgi:beta-glucosidase|nr:glycoside hydrolase family 3 C-terminal domain-containing protein [Bacilli bacterium]NLN79983.1 glycosyl hydrolase [Erysipelotrichia bacterium]